MNETIPSLVATAIGHDPTRPLLTWYDDATGDRTELSGATLDNWVAKTANLLVDGVGLGPADTVGVLLPPHWQSAVVLLGCWAAGVAVDHGPDPRPVEALFVATAGVADAARAWSAGERYVLGLLPLGAPMRQVPDGYLDFVVEVRGQGDRFVASGPVGPHDLAVAGPTELGHAELCEQAVSRAAELGITAGSRVLIDAVHHADPLDWLLAPLAVGASVVLCAQLDPSR
ncbi:MAG TPA: TIGR03089 family protein, partial [Catenuloplanes sp.]